MANKGYAFYLGVDGSPIPATVLTPGVFVVLEDYQGEPQDDALERVRLGLGQRVPIEQLRNVIALPTGRSLTNLVATPVSASKITIGWKRFPLAFSYEVQRSTDGVAFTPWQIVSQIGLNDPSINHTGLNQSTIYFYKVRARNALGIAISEWTFASTTTLIGLEAVQGTSTTTLPGWLTGIGFNATPGLDVLNVLFNFTEDIEAQISRNGELVTGTILGQNAGKFNAVGDTWVGYGGRIRLDRAIAGQDGVQVGDVITLKLRAVSNWQVNFVYTWTVTDVANTDPVALPLNSSNSGVKLQVFGQATWKRWLPAPAGSVRQISDRHWLGLNLYLFGTGPNGGLEQNDVDIIDYSAELGYNFINANINWDQIETTADGVYDFRKIDHLGARAKANNLPIFFRFTMKRGPNTKADGSKWIPDSEMVYDVDDHVHADDDGRMFSFSSLVMRAKMEQFVTATINHIMAQPYADMCMLWSLCTNARFEGAFSWKNLVDGQEVLTVYDFGPAARAGFRVWAEAKYTLLAASGQTPIAKANQVWGTNFASFAQVTLPRPADNGGYYGYYNQYQIDFYNFREQSIADTHLAFNSTVKGLIPGAKVAFEDGSLFDQRSGSQRSTITVAGRLYAIECIKQNGAADYSIQTIRRSTCISMRDWEANRIAADELGLANTPIEPQRQYMINFWASGGHLLTVALIYHPDLSFAQVKARLAALAGNDLAARLAVPVTNASDGTFTVNARTLVTNNWQDSNPQLFVQLENVPGDKTQIIYDYTTM